MESSTAVRARRTLQLLQPAHELGVVPTLLLEPSPTCSPVIGRVVFTPTRPADRLMDKAATVKIVKQLHLAAPSAPLGHLLSV